MTIDSANKDLILAALTSYYNIKISKAEQFKRCNMNNLAARERDTANQVLKLIGEIDLTQRGDRNDIR